MDQIKRLVSVLSSEDKLTNEPILPIPLPNLPEFPPIQLPNVTLPVIQWSTFLKLQNLWAFSHLLTILGTSTYLFAIISNNYHLWVFSYKVAVLGSIITYLVVLYRSNLSVEEEVVDVDESKTRVELVVETQRISASELLKNENAQLLGYAILWWITPESVFKILPFYLYSSLNITTFITTQVIPESAFAVAITPLLNFLEIPMLIGASHLDLIVFAVMLKQALISGSGYAFFIYSFIWVLRFETSEASRTSLNTCVNLLDELISADHQSFVYYNWRRCRWLLNKIVPLDKVIEDQEQTYADDDCECD